MMQATRNSILRHATGGSSRGLRDLRSALRLAKKRRYTSSFWQAVFGSMNLRKSGHKHVHPRHKRERRSSVLPPPINIDDEITIGGADDPGNNGEFVVTDVIRDSKWGVWHTISSKLRSWVRKVVGR